MVSADDESSSNMEQMMDKIRLHVLEKNTYASPKLKFSINMPDVPPVIPHLQRTKEINTEAQKRSIYLKKDLPGDEGLLKSVPFQSTVQTASTGSNQYDIILR